MAQDGHEAVASAGQQRASDEISRRSGIVSMAVQSGKNDRETPSAGTAIIMDSPFSRVTAWIFDLDNTLYPAECNLFAQVDQKMGEFVARLLDIPFEEARYLQKHYYRKFGTTLNGLMSVHKLDPKPFLDYVHDLDLAPVAASPDLSAAIGRLPGRKLIFTNGTVAHAERVAGKLGVLHHFEGIQDIVASDYVPKPKREPYDKFLTLHGIDARSAAMFEDMPHNLEVPHTLGMATVLVQSPAFDHPVQREIAGWDRPPAHIHHVTDNLTGFLDRIGTSAGRR
jgi:putative hydrolase of the HAD superfamily